MDDGHIDSVNRLSITPCVVMPTLRDWQLLYETGIFQMYFKFDEMRRK